MKIAILGAGNVGAALGVGWAARGHQIMFGVRNPDSAKIQDLLTRTGAKAANVADAAAFGQVIVLAVPYHSVSDVLANAGKLAGKILLDCTNPLSTDRSGLEVGLTTSAGEQVSMLAPGARVVKIFNNTGAGNMHDPRYGNEAATMFYCGDDVDAKVVAGNLARELGFDTVDAGPLREARLLESLAMLWIDLALRQKLGFNIAFKLLRR